MPTDITSIPRKFVEAVTAQSTAKAAEAETLKASGNLKMKIKNAKMVESDRPDAKRLLGWTDAQIDKVLADIAKINNK